MMISWTVDALLALRPCASYDRARVTALWAGRERVSALDVLDLDIPPQDRLWVIWRTPYSPAVIERITARAVTDHALHCGVPTVEGWAARWLSGEDRTRQGAARAAAAARAGEAAAAARAAAGAAWAAAWAGGAADAAEATAARARQIEDARAVILEMGAAREAER